MDQKYSCRFVGNYSWSLVWFLPSIADLPIYCPQLVTQWQSIIFHRHPDLMLLRRSNLCSIIFICSEMIKKPWLRLSRNIFQVTVNYDVMALVPPYHHHAFNAEIYYVFFYFGSRDIKLYIWNRSARKNYDINEF